MTKTFEEPIFIRIGSDDLRIDTIDGAVLALSDVRWPDRGPRHDEALETCLKAKDGHRDVAEARSTLVLAAQEAGLLSTSTP